MSKGNKQPEKKVVPVEVEEEDDDEDFAIGNFADLPSVVQRRVLALKKLHKDHLALEKKYREEVQALERKYQDLYAPLFTKRAAVVVGEHEPTDEEARIDDQDAIKADEKDKDIKGIPEFWLNVMRNNPAVSETITEEDEKALNHLKDIRYTRLEGDEPGFQLTFHFGENPYFTNTTLTKTYHLFDDDNLFGELVFDHAEGCDIKWKPGKNLTVKIIKKQSRPQRGGKRGGGGGGAGRVTTVEEPCESFFRFFSPPAPFGDDEEDDDAENDMLEQDFETGVIFKDKLIPHAALWFTGEALQYENDYDDFDEDGFMDGEDDEDDEDEDDEDEEEEEEERPKKGGGGGGRGGPPAKKGGAPHQLPPPSQKGGAPNQPQQPECKQQ